MNTETPALPEAGATPRGWGLHPAAGARFHWSARAIYRDGTVDLLWDRMGVEGQATEAERKALGAWLDDKAMPVLRALCLGEGAPYPSEDREVTVRGDGYTLRANPRSSHGYLYLSAALDPTSTEPTPKAPRARKRGRR